MALRGVFVGALSLLALHALVARANQAQLSGLVGTLSSIAERFLNPAVPAIPDRSAAATGASSTTPAPTTGASTSSIPAPTKR